MEKEAVEAIWELTVIDWIKDRRVRAPRSGNRLDFAKRASAAPKDMKGSIMMRTVQSASIYKLGLPLTYYQHCKESAVSPLST